MLEIRRQHTPYGYIPLHPICFHALEVFFWEAGLVLWAAGVLLSLEAGEEFGFLNLRLKGKKVSERLSLQESMSNREQASGYANRV